MNTDGSALTDVSGFRVYYGTSAGNLSKSADVAGASTRSYLVNGLSAATTYYFAVATKNAAGVVSLPSTTVSQRLP